MNIIRVITISLWMIVLTSSLLVAEDYAQVRVVDPYIELHTGPGRGFPVFFVAEQGEWIEIHKSKTSWYKVRLQSDKLGWVHRDQLQKTLTVDDKAVIIEDPDFQEYLNRNWEIGVLYGDFEGASLISLYGGYHFSENLTTELSVSQALGSFSEIRTATINMVNEPFPDLKPFKWLPYLEDVHLSPFFGVGAGAMKTLPRGTLVQPVDREDDLLFVTAGAKFYLTRRFLLRLEYRHFVVLTSRNDNEDVEEWKIGFSIFF
ncbi:MAG: hypothetical protein GY808_18195 [Gammaproteobacteria bacterium]|nr:hypothetical protein [Gammaproteobacteria bacterium]